MVRRKATADSRLEEAMALLSQAQTSLSQAQPSLVQANAMLAQSRVACLARNSEIDARMAETDRINSERFARIEAILMNLMSMMERLPEAICHKIGFKPPAS
jgi:hypothetical protein